MTDSPNENEEAPDPRTELPALAASAAAVLQGVFGGTITLGGPELLRQQYRNKVVRFLVTNGPADAPASIIVKTVEGRGEDAYDPDRYDPAKLESTTARFFNEWAGNRFLTELNVTPNVGARLYGGDRTAGLIVLEDLGKPNSLADFLQKEDRDALEAALVQYASGMGRLHAATAGRAGEFRRIRQEIAGTATESNASPGAEWRESQAKSFRAFCEKAESPLAPGFDAEVQRVGDWLDAPAVFDVFKPGDTCPDNHRLMDDGGTSFFDFEFAGFGNALLDAAYFYLPFPTCWCVNRLPEEQVSRMETAYRSELGRVCPEARDDAVFLTSLASACAYWVINTIAWQSDALEKDQPWGIASVRQRHPLRLENFARIAERASTLPALAQTARDLAARLRVLWSDTEPMPLYPAFRI